MNQEQKKEIPLNIGSGLTNLTDPDILDDEEFKTHLALTQKWCESVGVPYCLYAYITKGQ